MEINYELLLENVEKMIEIQEFDGLRSPGKIKMNAANLVDLYTLKDRYTKKLKTTMPTNKESK